MHVKHALSKLEPEILGSKAIEKVYLIRKAAIPKEGEKYVSK